MNFTLKEWRVLRGLTMEGLGDKVGKSKVTIWKWETGRTEPKISDMKNLRTALKLNAKDSIILPKRLT